MTQKKFYAVVIVVVETISSRDEKELEIHSRLTLGTSEETIVRLLRERGGTSLIKVISHFRFACSEVHPIKTFNPHSHNGVLYTFIVTHDAVPGKESGTIVMSSYNKFYPATAEFLAEYITGVGDNAAPIRGIQCVHFQSPFSSPF